MKIYNKLVLDIDRMSVLEEDSFEYSGPLELAAGGMLTKQGIQLTARFLNDVNDAVSGGQIFALPSAVQQPQYTDVIPGDRIVLDDATALALSDTAVGTLFGGVYMYVGTVSGTANPALGRFAFWRSNELPGGASNSYVATADPQPTAALPAYIAGVFINAITKGNFGWIQVAGVASVFFDTALTAAANASTVSAKVTASLTGAADAGVVLSTTTLAFVLGVSIGTPVTSLVSSVIITRGNFCGRI